MVMMIKDENRFKVVILMVLEDYIHPETSPPPPWSLTVTRCSMQFRSFLSNKTGRICLLILLWLCSGLARGQGFQGFRLLGISLDTLLLTKAPRVNTAYVTTYYRRLHVFVVSDRQQYGLHLTELPRPFIYRPNLAWTLGRRYRL